MIIQSAGDIKKLVGWAIKDSFVITVEGTVVPSVVLRLSNPVDGKMVDVKFMPVGTPVLSGNIILLNLGLNVATTPFEEEPREQK